MKRLCFSFLFVAVSTIFAGGFSKTFPLNTGAVTLGNTQKRSSWIPVAILFHFTEPVDTTVSIKRLSKGQEFLLSSITLSSVQDFTWIPEGDYPFNFGDTLVVYSSATNGTLEIIQRSSP
jgi:hypothetical protein